LSAAHQDAAVTGQRAPWLTPGAREIGAASLLADVGHEVPAALLPTLLTSTLGAPASALGLIEGVSDGVAGAARLGGGPWPTTHTAGAPPRSAATRPPPFCPA
jgi:hypothetical protein